MTIGKYSPLPATGITSVKETRAQNSLSYFSFYDFLFVLLAKIIYLLPAMAIPNLLQSLSPLKGTKRKPSQTTMDRLAEESRAMKRRKLTFPEFNNEEVNRRLAPLLSPKRAPRRSARGHRLGSISPRILWSQEEAYAALSLNTRPSTGKKPARRVTKFPDFISTISKGLPNKQNDCYRLGVLQGLLHMPAFHQYLHDIHQDCAKSYERCVVCALRELFRTYWSADLKKTRDSALSLFKACRHNLPDKALLGEEFRDEVKRGRQADPYDYLIYLLYHIGQAEPARGLSFEKMFGMATVRSWTCEGCGYEHRKLNDVEASAEALCLTVHLGEPERRGLHLTEYLKDKWRDSQFVFCDKPSCDPPKEFKEKNNGPKRDITIQIVRAPDVLFIMLLRFAWDHKYRQVKIKDHVPYPEYLDLSEFLADPGDLVYRLDGVTAHSGATVSGGHYIAAVRGHDGRTFAILDDERVRSNRTFDDMQKPRSRTGAFSPYILMYTRCD